MIVNSGPQPNIKIFEDSQAACKVVARHIANLVRERASAGCRAVLGLATGYTAIGVYNELIHMHKEEGLDFSNVVTFNLDEYHAIEAFVNWPISRSLQAASQLSRDDDKL